MPRPFLEIREEYLRVLRVDTRGYDVITEALMRLASDPAGLLPEAGGHRQVCDAEEMLVILGATDEDGSGQEIREEIHEARIAARDKIADELTADILIANLRREHADLVEAAEEEERLIREAAEDAGAPKGRLGTTAERQHLTDERASRRGPRGSVPHR